MLLFSVINAGTVVTANSYHHSNWYHCAYREKMGKLYQYFVSQVLSSVCRGVGCEGRAKAKRRLDIQTKTARPLAAEHVKNAEVCVSKT